MTIFYNHQPKNAGRTTVVAAAAAAEKERGTKGTHHELLGKKARDETRRDETNQLHTCRVNI